MRILMFLAAVATLHGGSLRADDSSPVRLATDDSVIDVTTCSACAYGGKVLLEGRYIAAPYHIVVVPDGIELNGHFVPEAGFNERSRRVRDNSSHVPFAERIRRRLDEGALLLGWEEGEYGVLGEARSSDILCALAAESTRDEKIDELEGLNISWIGRGEWRLLVERCELPESIRDEYRGQSDPLLVADPALAAAIGAPLRRFHMSIYLLTVVGIGATVFALGTLLSYRPAEKMAWSGVNLSKDATQLVLRSVILLIGLAVLDLVCTAISAQTASFWELNPLGAAALQSPLLLGTFKVGATLMSGGILLSLRRYHGAQVASWWLALFCTILAIRWVTFNSMFMA